MDGGRWERLGLQALASLPLWVAAALVAVFARDLAEVASAVVAGAGLISFAGLAALLVLARRVRVSDERHRQVVAQSLALVDCMKGMNRRVAEMEAAREPGLPPEAALSIATELGLPAAGNDPAMPVTSAGDAGADAGQHREHGARERSAPGRTPQEQIAQDRILRLDDGELVAKALRLRHRSVEDATEVAHLLAAAGGEPAGIAIEFAVPLALLRQPDSVKAIERALAGGGPPLLLLAGQEALRAATREEARALTRLTRLGLRLALTGAAPADATPEALAACAVAYVHVAREALLDSARADARHLMRWADALARKGIRLVADGVIDRRDAALLAALGASLGTHAAEEAREPRAASAQPRPAQTTPPQTPWRAVRAGAGRLAI